MRNAFLIFLIMKQYTAIFVGIVLMTAAIQARNGYCMKPQLIKVNAEKLKGTWYYQRRATTMLSSNNSFACKSLDITMGNKQNSILIHEKNEDPKTHNLRIINEDVEIDEEKGKGSVNISQFFPKGDIRFVHSDEDSMIIYSCKETGLFRLLGQLDTKSEGAYILTRKRFPSTATMDNVKRIFNEKLGHAYESMKMRKVRHDNCVTEDEAETD